MRIRLALALVFLAGPALAQDEPRRDEKKTEQKPVDDVARAIGFSSAKGLTGMRDMVDARCPDRLDVRGLLRFEWDSLTVDSRTREQSRDVYAAELIAGASALGFIDAGLRWPLEIVVDKDDVHGFSSRRVTANGVGDLELSGKAGFKLLPWVTLGPYATLHWNTGSALLEKTNSLAYGGAATVAFFDDRIAVHGNFTNVFQNAGKWGFGYRLGASFVALAEPAVVLRVYGYLDGLELVGSKVRGNDVSFAAGGQAIVFKIITLDVGTSVRVISQSLPHNFDDLGTWGLDIGGGVTLSF